MSRRIGVAPRTMATLEVHDAQGRVRFIDVDLDHPILFGTSATCDVVLEGEGVLPVHGRIRWSKRRFKVDASPDAESLTVNGRQVITASLHQGDELTVGPCRIFLLRLDEASPARVSSKRATRPDDEATKVLQGAPAQWSGTAAQSPSAPPPPSPRKSVFEKDDLFDALDDELPPRADDEAKPVETGRHRRDRARKGDKTAGPSLPARLLKRVFGNRSAESTPGREVVASSPMVLGLVTLLGLLIGMGVWLYAIINKTVATRTYNRAVSSMEDGDYMNAIHDFDSFLTGNPKDVRVGKARTLRALANVRQYITLSGATWSRALEAAREMADGVGDATEYRDEKTELAELVIRIGEGLADRAKRTVDPKSLAEAESAIPLHARIAGEPAQAFLTRSRLPDLLNDARAVIRKSQVRVEALSVMDKAIEQGSASQVYKTRDGLLQQYADLGRDPELLKRMVLANDLMRLAAKVDRSKRPAATTERLEPLGPPTTLVLRSSVETPPPPSPNSIAYALVDGTAYAIEGATGAPLWQTAVGLSSPFVPQAVPGDPSVLMVDARHSELVRRDARTGRLIWRLDLGEAVDAPPLVLGDQVVQTLPSGKAAVISLETGELQAAIDLGFPITRTPASDESGRFLYVMGSKDCLFVIARDPLGCAAVEYLGHGEGAIPCAPARLGRFLIVAENDRPQDGRWRVMVLDDDGAKPRAVQEVPVAGWTWDVPPSSGSTIWAVGDRGGIEAFAAGDYSSANPLRSLARLNPDADASGPAFALSTTEREIWIAADRSGRFDLDAERGEINSRTLLGRLGAASAPIQTVGRRIVLTFQESETGGLSLRGVESATGKIAWETVLGAPWPTPFASTDRDEGLTVVGRTGQRIRISRSQLKAGGFVASPLPKPGEPRMPDGFLLNLEREGASISLIAPKAGANAVWVEEPKSPGRWNRVELPAALAANPLTWAGALFVPGEDGRAYLIDPVSGKSDAEPLVPEFDRERQGRWLAPFGFDADTVFLTDDGGKVRKLGLKTQPGRRLVVEAETLLDRKVIADPACTASALILATDDGRLRALSVRDLSPIGAWPLDAPILGDPQAVDGRVVVFDTSGGVFFLGRGGQRAWSAKLNAQAAGAPLIVGDVVWILDQKGKAHGLAVLDGHQVATIDLGVLPAGGLVTAGAGVFAPSGRGVIQPLVLDQTPAEKP